jgi:hypothetical protein
VIRRTRFLAGVPVIPHLAPPPSGQRLTRNFGVWVFGIVGNGGGRPLEYLTGTALTTGRLVTGANARTAPRNVGIADEPQKPSEQGERAAEFPPQRQVVQLLGRDVPVAQADDGTLQLTTTVAGIGAER